MSCTYTLKTATGVLNFLNIYELDSYLNAHKAAFITEKGDIVYSLKDPLSLKYEAGRLKEYDAEFYSDKQKNTYNKLLKRDLEVIDKLKKLEISFHDDDVSLANEGVSVSKMAEKMAEIKPYSITEDIQRVITATKGMKDTEGKFAQRISTLVSQKANTLMGDLTHKAIESIIYGLKQNLKEGEDITIPASRQSFVNSRMPFATRKVKQQYNWLMGNGGQKSANGKGLKFLDEGEVKALQRFIEQQKRSAKVFANRNEITESYKLAEALLQANEIGVAFDKSAETGADSDAVFSQIARKALESFYDFITYAPNALNPDEHLFVVKDPNQAGQFVIDALLFAEQPIYSKQTLLTTKRTYDEYGDATEHKVEQHLVGRADIMIIDREGKVHVVDYKTSSDNSWVNKQQEKNDKLDKSYAQLMMYKKMLAESGVKESDIKLKVVPVEANSVISPEQFAGDFLDLLKSDDTPEKKSYGFRNLQLIISQFSMGINSSKSPFMDFDSIQPYERSAITAKLDQIFGERPISTEAKNLEEKRDNFLKKYFIEAQQKPKSQEDNINAYFQNHAEEDGVIKGQPAFKIADRTGKGTEKHTIRGTKEQVLNWIATNVYGKSMRDRTETSKSFVESFIEAKETGKYSMSEGLYSHEDRPGGFRSNIERRFLLSSRYQVLHFDDLAEQGIIVLLDTLSDNPQGKKMIHIIKATPQNLNTTFRFGGNNSILGNVRSKAQLREEQEGILQNTQFSVEALATLHQLLSKPELFSAEENDYCIEGMTIANISTSQYYEIPVSMLKRTYDKLSKGIDDKVNEDILDTSSAFSENLRQELSIAFQFVNKTLIDQTYYGATDNPNLINKTAKQISDYYHELSGMEYLTVDNMRDFITYTLQALTKVDPKLKSQDLEVRRSSEFFDVYSEYENLLVQKIANYEDMIAKDLTSMAILDSPSNSLNPAIRFAYKMTNECQQTIALQYSSDDILGEARKQTKKFLEAAGMSTAEKTVIGDQNRYFRTLFRTDANGNIDRRMLLKPLYIATADGVIKNPELKDYEWEYINFFTWQKFFMRAKYIHDAEYSAYKNLSLTELRNKYNEIITNKVDPEGETNDAVFKIYAVPLSRADESMMFNKIKTLKNIGKSISRYVQQDGLIQGVKNYISHGVDRWVRGYMTERQEQQARQYYDTEFSYLNFFSTQDRNLQERTKTIEDASQEGINFEMNLETLILGYSMEALKEHHYKRVLPILRAFKDVVAMQGAAQNLDLSETVKYVDDYIQDNIFNLNYHKDTELAFLRGIQLMKKLSSDILLSFNAVSFVRDLAEGITRNLTDSFLKTQATEYRPEDVASTMKEMFDPSELKRLYSVTKFQALNEKMRMANMDLEQMVMKTKSERIGIFNAVDSRYKFATVSQGDFYNRIFIAILEMKKLGCYDAVDIDYEKGTLTYDISKDHRFETFFAEKNKPKEQRSKEFYEEQAMLKLLVEDHNSMQISDESRVKVSTDFSSIPDEEFQKISFPLTQEQITSVKHIADMKFGFYDKVTRMKASSMPLGAAVLQFGTYLSARKDDYFAPGQLNRFQGEYVQAVDDKTGKALYRFTDSEGNTQITTDENIPGIEPVLRWKGSYMEGAVNTFGHMLVDFVEATQKEGDFLEKLKDINEYYKYRPLSANLRRLLRDLMCFIFSGFLASYFNKFMSKRGDDLSPFVATPLAIVARGTIQAHDGMFFLNDIKDRIFGQRNMLPFTSGVTRIKRAVTEIFSEDPDISKAIIQLWNGGRVFLEPTSKAYASTDEWWKD